LNWISVWLHISTWSGRHIIVTAAHTISLLVTLSPSLLDFWVVHLRLVIWGRVGQVGKDCSGVEQARIDALRGFEPQADDEDFGRDVSGRRGLCGFDLGEKLLEHPQQRVVILRSENLGDESTAFDEELGREFQRMKHKFGLVEGILHPSGTDVGRTIVQHTIGLPRLQVSSYRGAALFCRDIALEGDDLGNRLDGRKIDTDDETVLGHRLGGYLTPRTGSSAKIEHDLALLEEAIFLVELDQLESSTSSVSLLLGEFVPLVETTFAVFLLDRHRVIALVGCGWESEPRAM